MGFREKVALVYLAVITFQTACIISMPPIWSKRDSTKIFQKNNINIDNTLFNSENILQSAKMKPQTILKSFNFPEVEYSPARFAKPFRPETILEESPNVKVLDHSEFLNNFRKEKRRKRKYGSLKMPDQIPIGINSNKQNYLSQLEAFPQMEFPLTASETWAPSLWNQLSYPSHNPYFNYDKNIYKPQKNQILIQSNPIEKQKYATKTKPKVNNKIALTPKNNTVPISKNLDVNVLQANDQTFAKIIMHNTTTTSKLENDNDKPDMSDNVPKTSKPKGKPKRRKIKIVTKSSNVLRDLIAKKSNTSCSIQNNNSANNCSHKNQNETTNHAISDVINDRKNTEISDLLSDDFDVCFVNHNHGNTTNDDPHICVSFDHDKSTEELLPVSKILKWSKNDSYSWFDDLLNHTLNVENNYNNCKSIAEPEKLTKIVEKIVFSDVPKVEKLEKIMTDIKETVSILDDVENETLHNVSKIQQPTKILSGLHNDMIRKDTSLSTNPVQLANYELLDEVKEIRELDTDIVLSDLEHAIVNSKIDGTIDELIPKIKQAILEAIVESAAFVPSHIPTRFSPNRQNVNYDTNRYNMNDVEFINIDEEHNIESPDIISFMKEKYSVPNQTIELNVTETLNLTKTKENYLKHTLSENKLLENKTEPLDTLIPLTQRKAGLTIDKEFENEILRNHPMFNGIILKQNEKENKETEYNLTTITDNITDNVANKLLKELQMSNITARESNATIIEKNTNYTNQKVSEDFSTTATSNNTSDYTKMPVVKILLQSNNHNDENSQDSVKITAKNIDISSNQSEKNLTMLNDLETNSEINITQANNLVISDVLDNFNGYIIRDQDNDTDKEVINIANVTNNYKSKYVYEDDSFTDVVDGLTLKQDNITPFIASSDKLKSNINSPETTNYNEQEDHITLSHEGNYLNEINNIYIDQSRWEIKNREENVSQSLLNSDLETRILYADEKEKDSVPQGELLDALDVDENAHIIDHDFEDKITESSWLESNNTAPDVKLISEIETLSESLSHEIKSDFTLGDHPSIDKDISSDEFTDEIINAIIDILCIEDSECNNNTLPDNITDYTSIETNNETNNNLDGTKIIDEDKNVVLFTEDENISNNDFDSVLDLDSTINDDLPENTIFKNVENVDNAFDEIIKVNISKREPLLDTTQVDNLSSQDCQDRFLSEASETTSDNETEDELEHLLNKTKGTKESYLNVSKNNDSNTVEIDLIKLELENTCTEEIADNKDKATLNKNDGFYDVSSIEKIPNDNNVPENRITESVDGKVDENMTSNFETAKNYQNTAIDELLPDTGDTEV